jgi:hypothetical protein
MSTRKATSLTNSVSSAALRRITPNTVLTIDEARQALGLAKGCLPREIRLGRLRASKRAGRYWLRGIWILEWLDAGEVRRREIQAEAHGTNSDTSN